MATITTEDIFTPLFPTPWSSLPHTRSSIYREDILRPLYPGSGPWPGPGPWPVPDTRPWVFPKVVSGVGLTSISGLSAPFYYDSGIGENPIARHETNVDLRYKFLDKWVYEHYPEIIRMLKVSGSKVVVVSKSEAEKNDVSKDSESDLEKKSDFIGYEILTIHKNAKILETICRKNNLKYYDLPHNEYFVRKAQAKYVKGKLEEMQK